MTKVVQDEAANGRTESPPRADKQSIRAAILNSKAKSLPVTAFGFDLEVRQPSVATVLGLPTGEDKRARNLAFMLVNFVYMAGSDEKVFESADADALTSIPFSEDLQRIVEKINELTGVGQQAVTSAEKNSSPTGEG